MGVNYVFTADLDQSPCATIRKQKLVDKYARLESEKIIVVNQEIECWYVAGISPDKCDEVGIPILTTTEGITKEKFTDYSRSKFDSRIEFMIELLDRFDLETAKSMNGSFGYFLENYWSRHVVVGY